jgi:hypothetical protein
MRRVFAPRPVSATLPRQLGGALLRALVGCLLLAVPVVGLYAVTDRTFGVGDLGYEVAAPEHGAGADVAEAAPARGSQAWVIERAGCVAAPEGVFPGSVVVDPAGDRGWTHVTSQAGLGAAFEQLVFDGVLEANEWTQPVDHGMRVGVFCR